VYEGDKLIFTGKYEAKRIWQEIDRTVYLNTDRNVLLYQDTLYYIRQSDGALMAMNTSAPYPEVEHFKSQVPFEDYVFDELKLTILTKDGAVQEVNKKKSSGPLKEAEYWSCLLKLDNDYIAVGWNKTEKVNVFHLLGRELQLRSTLKIAAGSRNLPTMRVLPVLREKQILLISARYDKYIDIVWYSTKGLIHVDSNPVGTVYSLWEIKNEILIGGKGIQKVILGVKGDLAKNKKKGECTLI